MTRIDSAIWHPPLGQMQDSVESRHGRDVRLVSRSHRTRRNHRSHRLQQNV